MTTQSTDPVDVLMNELTSALQERPSPEFKNRVRADLPQTTPAFSWRMNSAMAAGVLGVCVIAFVIYGRSTKQRSSTEIPAPRPSFAVVSPPAPQQQFTREPIVVRHVKKAAPPQVLVPPDQADALDRLLIDLGTGRIDPTKLAVIEPVYLDPPPWPRPPQRPFVLPFGLRTVEATPEVALTPEPFPRDISKEKL